MKKVLFLLLIVFSAPSFSEGNNDLGKQIENLSDKEKVELLMSSGEAAKLYNFDTQSIDAIKRVDLLTPEDFEKYIPNIPEVREFFKLYIERGMDPYDAYLKTMQKLSEALKE